MCDTNITCVSLRLEAVPFLSMRTIWINRELMECLKCMCERYVYSNFNCFTVEKRLLFQKRKKEMQMKTSPCEIDGPNHPLIDYLPAIAASTLDLSRKM